ncbi:MAG: lipopolysaccharide biosynthesis protein [Blastomonas sp.]|jgi:O-antigen/teichoic acid export membrane protein|uniref:lipopolysaccharide biosynthesis protein n=1 Tax=Blastomonas TaxID=150203 RepID=UPI00083CE521|nr:MULTISPECIES: lipopolysaccharide biosynthesis protein [Blastomonas]AOG01377.1 polysaccharide biosynthesis family protein [Blastomonas sp. RAC04]MCO5791546.1 lipopolysaccharide biosynthesis protein [Blastomonas sp.]MDK2758286.1 lipopolysaccharide biosynthesis protein [Blastomonas fulva]MDM7966100.1 lipopolysaccharide biosynthesis protein [Blastomonas fulva]
MVEDTAPGITDSGFANRVKTAVFWRSGSQIVSQLVMWTTTLAVIRILDPSDYGLFAMTQVVMVMLTFLNGYGFASSLIQQERIDRFRVRQAFGLLLILNFGIAAIQFTAAPAIAAYYNQPMVTDLLRWQTIMYIATPFMAVPEVLMSRALDFRRLAIVNLVSAFVCATTSIVCALSGWGVWTLVAAPASMVWTRAIGLCIAQRFIVWPSFNFKGTGAMIGFGGAMLTSHLLWSIQTQADVLIAGRALDPHALGLYAEALFLAQMFSAKVIPPLNEVAFPAYARLQAEPARLQAAFLKAIALIMLISCPVYAGLAVTAPEAVYTLFGAKWLEMVPLVQLFAIAMPFMTLHVLMAPAVNALGHPRITVRCSAFGAVVMPLMFLIGVQFGVNGLAMGWVIGMPLVLAFTLWQSCPVIGVRVRDVLIACAPGVGAAAAMAALVWTMRVGLAGALDSNLGEVMARLALLAGLGALSYVLLLRMLAPQMLRDAIGLLRRQPPPLEEPVAA